METLTAVIITQNEAHNIGRCLESLQGVADEVVVVDSGSSDESESICRKAGVRFEHHDWEGYSGQKNYADSLASCNWTLSIDADEALSDTLRDTLLRLKREGMDGGTVYSVCRLNNYCGHWMRHGGWRPDEHVRLWRTGTAAWCGEVHEQLTFCQPMKRLRLQGDLLHYTYYTVDDHALRTVRYARLAGEKAFAEGRRCGGMAVVLKPVGTFLTKYLLKGGYRDGLMGYTAARILSTYTLVKYARLRELTLESNREGRS